MLVTLAEAIRMIEQAREIWLAIHFFQPRPDMHDSACIQIQKHYILGYLRESLDDENVCHGKLSIKKGNDGRLYIAWKQ